jgi:hypothetical protein
MLRFIVHALLAAGSLASCATPIEIPYSESPRPADGGIRTADAGPPPSVDGPGSFTEGEIGNGGMRNGDGFDSIAGDGGSADAVGNDAAGGDAARDLGPADAAGDGAGGDVGLGDAAGDDTLGSDAPPHDADATRGPPATDA